MTHKIAHDSIDLLLEIMQTLRSPQGCPWDAEQTPESLAPYIIEEACELVDAIEGGNLEQIKDELGDLLLQVVFQAQIFSEREQFCFEDIAQGIADKLIRRHPHVFEDRNKKTGRVELDKQWEEIKQKESTQTKSCLADHLPGKLPALQHAQKLISKTHKIDRSDELPETGGVLSVISKQNAYDINLDEETIGQTIFAMTMLAHDAGIDAETALRKTTKKILLKLDNK
jgi:MazG family protein